MDVVSHGPFLSGSVVWQPRPGTFIFTVVAKATYLLRAGECPLAPSQEAPAAEDRYLNDDPSRSLRQPRDLVPAKPNAEVVLLGSAFAPERRPTRALIARLVVGEVDKSTEVVADRLVGGDGVVREGAPFVQMPLAYERAAGGPGTQNPVGVARGARDAEGRIVLPNLQRPGSPPNAIEPVGFGPIAPSWPERRDRLSGTASGWSFRDLTLRALPEGMDLGYFNAAPRDQLVRALGAGESIILENLHPDHPRLATRLPGLAPRATLEGRRSGPVSVAMRADTLWIDTDRALCTLTFRGMIPLESADEQGRVVVVMERAASTSESSAVMRAPEMPPASEAVPKARRYEMTADIPLSARQVPGTVLPFAPAPEPSPPPPRPVVSDTPWAAVAPIVPAAPVIIRPVPAPSPAVLEASNAAAGAQPAPASVAAFAPEPMPEPRSTPRAVVTEAIDLVWFDPKAVSRMRRKPVWKRILDAAERSPEDPDLDDPALAEDPMAVEDRREVFEVLARAEPMSAAQVEEAPARCQREDGKFVPTLALFASELEMPFDEVAALRATLSTVTPLVGADESLRGTVDTARDLLALPDLMAAPAVAEGLTKRIDQAFSQGKRAVPADYLEVQRERVLLEQRRYQRRPVFGEKMLRGLLRLDPAEPPPTRLGGGKPPPAANAITVYLPESAADLLPLSARFRARFIAEIRLSPDPAEAQPLALRMLALARTVPAAKR